MTSIDIKPSEGLHFLYFLVFIMPGKHSVSFFFATLTDFRGFQLTDIFPATAVWGGIALKHVTLNFDKASVVCRRYGFHRLPMGVR